MKQKKSKLLSAYRDALELYLKTEPRCDLKPAKKLGAQALGLGLEILDLAKLHQEVLTSLAADPIFSGNYSDVILLANAFFAEAVTPIEASYRTARGMDKKLTSTTDKLKNLTADLADANLALDTEKERREGAESSLVASEATTSKLLEGALQLQEDLRLLSRRLLVVQEDERKRISRELHDIVAQTLTGINLRLAILTLQTDVNTEDMHQKIIDIQKLVEQSVEVVHRFAQDLRPSVLDDLGLVPALKSHLKNFIEQSGIQGQLMGCTDIEKLNNEYSEVLFRVAQEALSNAEKHSKATNAKVILRMLKDVVQMEIHDDGEGFKLEEFDRSNGCQRLGLLGMRERVEMIGGQFNVESVIGKGTIVSVDIPWSPDKDPVESSGKPINVLIR